jgi:ribosome-binding factor A
MKTRRIPELSFRLDNTMEKAAKVLKIINDISSEEKPEP